MAEVEWMSLKLNPADSEDMDILWRAQANRPFLYRGMMLKASTVSTGPKIGVRLFAKPVKQEQES